MDSKDMVNRCQENFDRIYGLRRTRKGFRKSEFKENVAVAASILRQMVLLRMPRPPEHVATLCGLESASPLLRVDALLNFSKEEKVMTVQYYSAVLQYSTVHSINIINNNCHCRYR